MIDKKAMEELRKNVGKNVSVEYAWYGSEYKERYILKSVDEFTNIEFGNLGIPFVGYGCAIQRITDENGRIIYNNSNIDSAYDVRSDQLIDEVRKTTFGDKVAKKFIDERERERKRWEMKKERLDKKAQKSSIRFRDLGRTLIKSELVDEWDKYVSANTKDFYSSGVVDASLRVMKALSEGKSPKKAEKTVYDLGITGFQMGCVAQEVSYFHPRGEEFREYWNGQYLPKNKVKKTKGVVNPAIWTTE